ncbi:hypothetical protein F4861DRAFT_504751 [Xylaria intraflava]|nr:hypothetical protein F4861DRAFT_504751 [Xylaria intraflava]
MNCLQSPARVLHRVLLLELANTANKSSIASPLPNLRHAHATRQSLLSAPCCRVRCFSRTSSATQYLADWNIPFRWVRVRDESGGLSPPQRTDTVLSRLPRDQSLIMVAPPPERPPPPPTGVQPVVLQISAAICRIVNREEERAKSEAAIAAGKAALQEAAWIKKTTKTLEINWGTAPHDLGHKMKRLAEFLGKGLRVEVVLARKKGTKEATPEQCTTLVESVREVLGTVPGSIEFKKEFGEKGRFLKLYFQGPYSARKKALKFGKAD